MRLDSWMLSLDLARVDGDLEEAAREVLVTSAESFLRAGGTVTLTEWKALSEESQSAFITAGDRLRSLEAYMFGTAARSRTEALMMLSRADGGDQYVRELLAKTVEIASSRLEAKRPVETSP